MDFDGNCEYTLTLFSSKFACSPHQMSETEVDSDKQFILPYIKAVAADLNDSEVEQVVEKCRNKIIHDINTVPRTDYHMRFFSEEVSYNDSNGEKRCIKHCKIISFLC